MSLPRTPFLTAVPEDWSQLTESAAAAEPVACRRAHAHPLIRQQWRLQQARAPRRAATLIDQAVGMGDQPPPPAARLVPALSHCAPVPVINVVCENRRWLFKDWKHALVAAGQPGFQVLVSSQPLPTAAAWIFLRAAEVARTPDPQRTGVQIHDLAGGALYRPGGARAGVAACAALSLTHPAQIELLEEDGIAVGHRRWIMQPVGWRETAPSEPVASARPKVAWSAGPRAATELRSAVSTCLCPPPAAGRASPRSC